MIVNCNLDGANFSQFSFRAGGSVIAGGVSSNAYGLSFDNNNLDRVSFLNCQFIVSSAEVKAGSTVYGVVCIDINSFILIVVKFQPQKYLFFFVSFHFNTLLLSFSLQLTFEILIYGNFIDQLLSSYRVFYSLKAIIWRVRL